MTAKMTFLRVQAHTSAAITNIISDIPRYKMFYVHYKIF